MKDMDSHTYKQTNRKTDRQIERQTDLLWKLRFVVVLAEVSVCRVVASQAELLDHLENKRNFLNKNRKTVYIYNLLRLISSYTL